MPRCEKISVSVVFLTAGIGTHIRCWRAAIDTGVAQSVTMLIIQAILLGVSLWLWQQGRASAGDVAYVLTSFMLVNGYLRDVGQHIREAQHAVNDIEDVVEYAMTAPEVLDRPDAGELDVFKGEIRFDGVTFAYPKSGEPVFDDLNLVIEPGEKVALVGHSGSGKSTFVKLLQRLYDLKDGRIVIDGQDISSVTQSSLRQSMALVPQEPVLFHRSLAENIAYGRPGADLQAIQSAARMAEADGFIQELVDGYDTLVGERGVKLSGGERQRVAIARAILADLPILILDEATSSLDSISELSIQRALDRLMKDRTTLVIAHRLSTVRQVDRILVFEKGRIIEEGTHDALLDHEDGRYRRLYETQGRRVRKKTSFLVHFRDKSNHPLPHTTTRYGRVLVGGWVGGAGWSRVNLTRKCKTKETAAATSVAAAVAVLKFENQPSAGLINQTADWEDLVNFMGGGRLSDFEIYCAVVAG